MLIQPRDHILFFGDSITDCGKSAHPDNPDILGNGYVKQVAARLLAAYPDWQLRFSNCGISGNRVCDLEERLEKDVLRRKPDVVSLLIGINDTWRSFDSNRPSPPEKFSASYERILRRLLSRKIRVILLELFLLPVPEDRRAWRSDLDARIDAMRSLAWKWKLPYLPLDGLFAAAAVTTGLSYWLPDGVHPSLAGHAFIADHWLALLSRLTPQNASTTPGGSPRKRT